MGLKDKELIEGKAEIEEHRDGTLAIKYYLHLGKAAIISKIDEMVEERIRKDLGSLIETKLGPIVERAVKEALKQKRSSSPLPTIDPKNIIQ